MAGIRGGGDGFRCDATLAAFAERRSTPSSTTPTRPHVNDFNVFGSYLSETHAQKITKIQDMALKNRAPIVGLFDAGGRAEFKRTAGPYRAAAVAGAAA